MSLGPPFDAGSERLRLLIGGVTLLLLTFLVSVALLTAEHQLGQSLTLHLLVERSGPLYTGAEVHLAGERIGELVAIRRHRIRPGDSIDLPVGSEHVELELRILRTAGQRLFRGSTFVPRNPTLLSPAVIEVGPPDPGQDKGPPLSGGEYLIGIDPPDLDLLLRNIYVSLEAILAEARDLQPDWQEAVAAFSALSGRLDRVADSGQVLRIGYQGAKTLVLLRSLESRLVQAGIGDAPAQLADLSATLSPLVQSAGQLGQQTGRLHDRMTELSVLFQPSRRKDAQVALRNFQAAIASGERLTQDAQYLLHLFESGQGTLGGFNRDVQLFDELKDVARILKQQLHRVIIKSRK